MEFDPQQWQDVLGRPLPPLMKLFFEWLEDREYGDLGFFELRPDDLRDHGGWAALDRVAPTTWGFLHLPDGSLVALCEAVQPAAVVLIGSEGELKTVAESFAAFLYDWSQRSTGVFDLDGDEYEEDEALLERQNEAFAALRGLLGALEIPVPPVSGQFDFGAYADGAEPHRLQPGLRHTPAQAFDPEYLALLDGADPQFRELCDLLGRTSDDAQVCAAVSQLFGKAPRQSINNGAFDDDASLYGNGSPYQLSFSRNVLNRRYPPVALDEWTKTPHFYKVFIEDIDAQPLLFGVSGDALWQELERRYPGQVVEDTLEDGDQRKVVELLLDEQRDLELYLNSARGGGYVAIREGRSLLPDYDMNKVGSGAGLFVQWALERGWLARGMFDGYEALLDKLANRQVRPSQLVSAALPRGLWDTHLRDEPGLRRFAYVYFHNMLHAIDDFWITADLKNLFGEREGAFGHDEPVLDDDPQEIFDRVFAQFDKRYAQWQAHKEDDD